MKKYLVEAEIMTTERIVVSVPDDIEWYNLDEWMQTHYGTCEFEPDDIEYDRPRFHIVPVTLPEIDPGLTLDYQADGDLTIKY